MNDFTDNCDCNHWPQRLLRQGCLHDGCWRCDASSSKTAAVENSLVDYCGSTGKVELVCTKCDDAKKKMVAEGTCFPTYLAVPLFPAETESAPMPSDDLFMCSCCTEKSLFPRRNAEYFCESCPVHLLCSDCKQVHDKLCGLKHNVWPLDDKDAQAQVEHWLKLIPAVICGLHHSTCDQWCSTCGAARCHLCAELCTKSHHVIASGNEVNLQKQCTELLSSTRELEATLRSFGRINSVQHQELEADLQELLDRKKSILNAIDSAYYASRDGLILSFQDCRQSNRNLQYAIESAANCSRLLTQHPLPSHKIVMQGAQDAVECLLRKANRLVGREEDQPARLGSTSLSDDVDNTVRNWIGSPVKHTVATKQCTTPIGISASNHLPLSCHDFAITHCEHVLMALGKDGLLELDSRGTPLVKWIPTLSSVTNISPNQPSETLQSNVDEVMAVDCLDDDRFAVGLKNSHSVAILERINTGRGFDWKEGHRCDLGHAVPVAVAGRDELVVVATGLVDKDSGLIYPGNDLIAFDAKTGTRCATTNLNFATESVSVTAESSVIVSSHCRVSLYDDFKGRFLLQCLTSDLQTSVWIVPFVNEIVSVAASSFGALVYTCLSWEQGQKLIALDSTSGLPSRDALLYSNTNTQNPGIPGTLNQSNGGDRKTSKCYNPNFCKGICSCSFTRSWAYHTSIGTENRGCCLSADQRIRKLSCGKGKSKNLAALRHDSSTIVYLPTDLDFVYLPTDLDELSQKYPQPSRLYPSKKIYTGLAVAAASLLLKSLVIPILLLTLKLILIYTPVAVASFSESEHFTQLINAYTQWLQPGDHNTGEVIALPLLILIILVIGVPRNFYTWTRCSANFVSSESFLIVLASSLCDLLNFRTQSERPSNVLIQNVTNAFWSEIVIPRRFLQEFIMFFGQQ